MIGLLTGIIVSVEPDRCILDVNGVGYLVSASSRTLANLPLRRKKPGYSSRPSCAKMLSSFSAF